MFDLDAYLERLGLERSPSLPELTRAHVASIPFENLDPHRGVPVSLEPESLQRKLVTDRRGGYCFEHNLLLAAGLEALGFEVELMLARVRVGAPPGFVRPRTHLLLRVHADDGVWHADVGFGSGTLLEPLPFGAGEIHEQAGWRFRVVPEGDLLVLQTESEGGWTDLYAFLPDPVPRIDVETSNWYAATHPSSGFVTGLLIATVDRDGGRTIISDWGELSLIEQTPCGRTVTPITREEIPGLLRTRFGLSGFELTAEGRLALAEPSG